MLNVGFNNSAFQIQNISQTVADRQLEGHAWDHQDPSTLSFLEILKMVAPRSTTIWANIEQPCHNCGDYMVSAEQCVRAIDQNVLKAKKTIAN